MLVCLISVSNIFKRTIYITLYNTYIRNYITSNIRLSIPKFDFLVFFDIFLTFRPIAQNELQNFYAKSTQNHTLNIFLVNVFYGISAYFMLEYNSRRELNTARFWKANFRTNFVKNLEIRQYSFGFFLVIAKIFALQNCKHLKL